MLSRFLQIGMLLTSFGVMLAACGGGGGSTAGSAPQPIVTMQAPAATDTPLPVPAASPFSVSTDVPVPIDPAGSTVSLPLVQAGDSAAQGTLPIDAGFSSTTAQLDFSDQPPADVGPLAFLRQQTTTRTTLSNRVTVLSFCITFPVTIRLKTPPTFVFFVKSSYIIPGVSFYLALHDPTVGVWNYDYGGPGVVNGQTVTISGDYPLTFPAKQKVCLALYEQSSSIPPPTPPPTPSPSPTPTGHGTPTPSPSPTATSGSITATPASLSFLGTGASSAQTFAASEGGYAGSFTAVSANPGVVSVSTTDGHTFSVVPVASGTTSLAVTDSNGHSTAVAASVTITVIPIQ